MTGAPALTDSTLTLDGRVATLTLDRNDVRNALTGTRLGDESDFVTGQTLVVDGGQLAYG